MAVLVPFYLFMYNNIIEVNILIYQDSGNNKNVFVISELDNENDIREHLKKFNKDVNYKLFKLNSDIIKILENIQQ